MKKLITNYNFDASEKKITFSDYTSIDQEGLLLITNVKTNQIIYNFADANAGGTVSGNQLTLTYNTTSMLDTDPLQIYYDDANVSPATQLTLESLEDMIDYLKVLVSNTKSLQTQDTAQRLRVAVDNSSTINVQGTVTANTQSIYGEIAIRQESSRNEFANGIRANLIF